ncbi:hypothetical protein HOLleu_01827 [Holothuria leucospilota]|uniref:B box-type domain-containing protein n=1 Tax=Holothuria leucospilota TaxID=206669 RepID=A0A9Q1HJF8_HOLLE|nr:hypothetical protein HOLleu_01827 [Holothuria leucospilota]
MGFCGKHNDIECRFFCNTCGIPVCHVCMERGDHVISKHDCIPVTQYCETKSNKIRTVLEEATKHKIRYDKINSKWDMHLSGIVGEFDKIKNEILLTKQHLLQQLDLDEQLQLKAAEIEKAKLETAVKFVQCSHAQTFSGVYQQLNDKCQFLLRNPSSHKSEDKEAVFEECQKLSNKLHQSLTNFEEENLFGINVAFVPSQVCSLGEVVVPRDARCLTGSALESSNPKVSEEPTRKRKERDSDTIAMSIKKTNVERSAGEDDPSSNQIRNSSTSNTESKLSSQDSTTKSAPAAETKRSNQDGAITSASSTNLTQSYEDSNVKGTVDADSKQVNCDGRTSMSATPSQINPRQFPIIIPLGTSLPDFSPRGMLPTGNAFHWGGQTRAMLPTGNVSTGNAFHWGGQAGGMLPTGNVPQGEYLRGMFPAGNAPHGGYFPWRMPPRW